MKHSESLNVGQKPAPDDLVYVQGFVNTLDFETGADSFADPSGVASWFSLHGHKPAGGRVSVDERQRVVAVREALRALLRSARGEVLPAHHVAALNEVSERSPLTLTAGETGQVALEARGEDIDSQLAQLLVIVHRSQLAGTWERLKVCAADSCQWAFYDSSRNRSGNWCSMEVCGNREKVRAHRAKHEHS